MPTPLPTLALALALLGATLACSTEDAKTSGKGVGLQSLDVRDAPLSAAAAGAAGVAGVAAGADATKAAPGAALPAESSAAIYGETVYPLVNAHCASCHAATSAPFFAAADVTAAHDAVLTTQKVDFADAAASRLVLRLAKDNHHCWSTCDADAAAMTAAIEAWATRRGKDKSAAGGAPARTTELALGDAQKSPAPSANAPNVIALEAESGVLKAPMRMVPVTAASGGKVVDTPVGSGSQTNVTAAAADAALGGVTYDFEVTEAGTYRVLGLVNAPDVNSSSFYLKMDAGALLPWRFPATGTAYNWDVADPVAGAGTPHQFVLAAGMHRLEIRQRQQLTKIDTVIITSDATLDPTTVKPGGATVDVQVLTFDIADAAKVPGAKLTVEVSDYSANAYLFKNPTIVSDKPLHVKGLKLLINGVSLAQNATYSEVDLTVAAPGGSLSPAAMVAVKDRGADQDKFAFTFDTIEIPASK